MNLVNHLIRSISNAEIGLSKLDQTVLSVPGETGIKIKHFLK